MKYLKYQKEYKIELLQEAVEDAFANDITFGGSLLGRLINSTLRKMKIGFNYTRVDSIVKLVKKELYYLLRDCLSKDTKENIDNIIIRELLEKTYSESVSKKNIKEKLDVLLGTHSIEGLIDQVINEIEKSEFNSKNELLEKLKKFKEELLKIHREEGDNEEENDENKEESDSDNKIFYQSTKDLLIAVSKIHLDIKNNTVKLSIGVNNVGVKVPTFFDEKKYQQQRSNTPDEISKKISLAKQAVSIYTSKNDKGKVNFYTNEVKKYQSKLDNINKNKTNSNSNQDKSNSDSKEVNLHDDSKNGDSHSDQQKHDNDHKKEPEMQTASYKFNEANVSLKNQKEDARNAWKKVINAHNKSNISKFIPYIDKLVNTEGADKIKENRKKIIIIGKQIILNNNNIGKPISFDSLISEQQGLSTTDMAKSISLFSRVLLAFSKDMDLIKSYISSNKDADGGVGYNIKSFIDSFNKMNQLYPSLKKESLILKYKKFKIINENNGEENNQENNKQETDEVKKSWFKCFNGGEEKNWKITNEDKDLKEGVESELKETKIPNPENDDHIIKIVNLFGRAYDLYATDYIPSGRPAGRVSQKTLREYEYLGNGSPITSSASEGIIPGYGPWVAKLIYNKWQKGITNILENKQLRRILANAKFVSDAESSTNTPMTGDKKPGSGKTLFMFINDMLDNDKGSFRKHRNAVFKKYFGVDDETIKGKIDHTVGSGGYQYISSEDKGEIDEPIFIGASPTGIKDCLGQVNRILKVTGNIKGVDKIYIISTYVVKTTDSKEKFILFKYQVCTISNPKQSLISTYLKGQKNTENQEYKTDKIEMPYSDDMEYYIGCVNLDIKNSFYIGGDFKFKSVTAIDANAAKSKNNFEGIKIDDWTLHIKSIEQLVVPVISEKTNKQTNKTIVIVPGILGNNRSSKDVAMNDDLNKKLIQQFKK